MNPANSIPNFLQASSPKGLVELMILNNASKGKYHNYFSVVFDGNNWVAWYYEEYSKFDNVKHRIELRGRNDKKSSN